MTTEKSIYFLHGQEGNTKGYKAIMLSRLFEHIKVPYFEGSMTKRMHKLRELLAEESDIVLIGSSMGGLMATLYALEAPSQVDKLILLAPALPLFDWSYTNHPIDLPVIIFHGKADDIVPLPEAKADAQALFRNLTFKEVKDGHRLKNTVDEIDWRGIVER